MPAVRNPVSDTRESIPVLEQHRFDVAALERFLREKVPELEPPLNVRQFEGGMSNPTFMLVDGAGRRFVMRKKPPGKLLPSAHAVDREYRVITALHPTDVPVAKPYVLCEDESVIGQAFYVMEHVEGRIFRDFTLPDLPPSERSIVYDVMNDVLARLHKVDFRAVGLEGYGKVGGYIERQVRLWTRQYELTKTEELPSMENLMRWLPENLPREDETTIVHGDFRLENMIWHPSEYRVLAVVDWELGTLGHPLSDLAYLCLPYYYADRHRGDITSIDYASYGIPGEEDFVAAYCRRTGRDGIEDWPVYIIVSLFRLAAIAQGVYKRGVDGNAASPRAIERREMCRQLADIAWSLVEGRRRG